MGSANKRLRGVFHAIRPPPTSFRVTRRGSQVGGVLDGFREWMCSVSESALCPGLSPDQGKVPPTFFHMAR